MEDLVHDFPLAIYFEQRKQVGESMAGPVVEFQTHSGNRLGDIDARNSTLQICCWTIHDTKISLVTIQLEPVVSRQRHYLIAIGFMIACTPPVIRAGPSVNRNSQAWSFTISSVFMFSSM